MNISPISNYTNQNQTKPNFGHSFRVRIGIVDSNGLNYQIVNPASNEKLYKSLNSKFVTWMNEGFLTRLREAVGIPRKQSRKLSDSEKAIKEKLEVALTNVDKDYKEFSTIRSVYRRNHYGYVVTGADVPIIENIKGAKQIGKAKSEAILNGQSTHSPFIKEVVNQYKNDSQKYVEDPINILRDKDGREIMLDLNFVPIGKDKKGNERYELFGFDFHSLKTSIPFFRNESDLLRKQINIDEYIRKTIGHSQKRFVSKRFNDAELKEIIRSHATDVVPAEKQVQEVTQKSVEVVNEQKNL